MVLVAQIRPNVSRRDQQTGHLYFAQLSGAQRTAESALNLFSAFGDNDRIAINGSSLRSNSVEPNNHLLHIDRGRILRIYSLVSVAAEKFTAPLHAPYRGVTPGSTLPDVAQVVPRRCSAAVSNRRWMARRATQYRSSGGTVSSVSSADVAGRFALPPQIPVRDTVPSPRRETAPAATCRTRWSACS